MSFDRTRLPDPASYFDVQEMHLIGPTSAKWKTTACKFHGGSDSMRVNTHSGGWICMACEVKGGDVLAYHMQANALGFVEAARALGAWADDGRPAGAQRPAPLPPRAALEVLAFEAMFAALAASNIARGVKLSADDLSRLMVAAARITRISEAYR